MFTTQKGEQSSGLTPSFAKPRERADQHPHLALGMLQIQSILGVSSTCVCCGHLPVLGTGFCQTRAWVSYSAAVGLISILLCRTVFLPLASSCETAALSSLEHRSHFNGAL